MNKAKYVEKMTDLVENTLLDMGVSPYFTIEDGWEEDEELSMTLSHDANDHEKEFNLTLLYQQKKEEDVKVKDQYNSKIKPIVVAFVEEEKLLNLDNDYDEDYDEEYEEDYEDEYDEDYDDYDEEDEEYDEEEIEDEEEDEYDPDFDDEEDEEEEEEEERPIPVSRSIQDFFAPLKFAPVNENQNVMAATLPQNFSGDISNIVRRYGKQIEELFEGSFLIHPNKKDILVLSSEDFDRDEVESILEELYEEGGEKVVIDFPDNEKER